MPRLLLPRPLLRSLALLGLLAFPHETVEAQLIVAHRGASHDAPENTLAAFELAWEQGADGIEGDFHLTADGKIVCLHDYDTERVAGEKHVVKDSTLAELRRLDVGAWKDARFAGERTPTLDEVLATIPEGKRFFLEIKCGPEIVEPLAEQLEASGFDLDRLVIISFHDDVVAACKEALPTVATQWLTSFKKRDGHWSPTAQDVASKASACGADAVGVKAERRWFDDEFVEAMGQLTVRRFGVWTVDDPAVARYYRGLGAWSITTNRPGWLRERLEDR